MPTSIRASVTCLLAATACWSGVRPAWSAPGDPSISAVRQSTDISPGVVLPNGSGPLPSATSTSGVGPAAASGAELAKVGVYFNLFDVAQYQAVTAGGIDHGSFFTNWAVLETDLDLARLLDISGGAIHFAANDVAGQGRAYQFTGAYWSTLNNWALRDGMQLRELTWDQHLLDDRLLLLAGRFNATADSFDRSELYCQFATFLCSTPRMFLVDTAGPTFENSSWMGRVAYHFTKLSYVKVAVFEEEPWLRTNNHNGWPGPDWGLNQSAGALIPFEFGYKSSFRKDRYPREYVIGGTYDSIAYADPLYNTAQQAKVTHGGAPQMHSGRSTIYLQAQQMIWRPTFAADRGMILFGAANLLTSGYGVMRDSYTVGIFDWGPFRQRTEDLVAVACEVNLFNHRTVAASDLLAAKSGVPSNMSGNETELEAIYGAHLARGVTLSPYIEYVWHPDQLTSLPLRRDLDHAVQVGAMLRVSLNEMLGLPTLARVQY